MATGAFKNQRKDQQKHEVVDKRRFHPDKFVHSSLFSEVYVLKDLPIEQENIWENFQPTGYYEFFDRLLLIMNSFGPQEAEKWNHSQTNENLVFPMLEALGWGNIKSINNSFLENHNTSFSDSEGSVINLRPSLLICEDERGKNFIKNAKQEDALKELKRYLKVPVVTSYYSACHDRRSSKYDHKKDEIGRRGDVYSNLGPDNQVLEYLNILDVPWGIFTDGSTWRLYRKEIVSDGEKFFEFDFSELYNLYRTSPADAKSEESEFFEIAKYLYWFFSKEALVEAKPVIPFLESIYDKSQQYVERIKEDLKEKYVHVMTVACNGYLRDIQKKNKDVDIKLVAKTAESFIFNLIFIRSCESKRILPLHQDYLPASLKILVDKIKHFSLTVSWEHSGDIVKQSLSSLFGKKIEDDGCEIYKHLQQLHDVIENGNNGLKVTGFIETVFYPEEKEIYKRFSIRNKEMIPLLFQLFYEFRNGINVQIPYSLITPRQFGSIYESFLEFQPDIAKVKMTYVKKNTKGKTYWQWEELSDNANDSVLGAFGVSKGDIVFSPNNKERKTTGTYYTPDFIVNYIVKETLSSFCEGRQVKEILKLRICDPSMGSAHFLLGVVDYLSKKISEKEIGQSIDKIRRDVLAKCIYGADINSSAVKLGKLSLWLSTVAAGKELENLEDQLVISDALVLDWKKAFPEVANGAFDCVVGNPPWGACSFDSSSVDEAENENLQNINIFELFCRLSLRITKPDASIGLLLPRNVIRKDTYADVRAAMLPFLTLISDAGKFEGVMQEACAIMLNKGSATSPMFVTNDFLKKIQAATPTPFDTNTISKKDVVAPNYLFQLNKKNDLDEIVLKLKGMKKLDDFFSISRGIECGKKGEHVCCPSCKTYTTPPKKKNAKGSFEKDCPECGKKITLKDVVVEIISSSAPSKSSQKIIAGPDIFPFGFKCSRSIITGLKGVNYKEKLFEKKQRLYVPMNNDKIVAALDKKGELLATKTVYVLNSKKKNLNLEYFCRVLNSKLIRFYFEYLVNNGAELTNSIPNKELCSLPVSYPDDKLLAKVIGSQNYDEILFEVYGLDREQQKVIEDFIREIERKAA